MPGEEHMKAALQQYIDAFRNRDAETLPLTQVYRVPWTDEGWQ